MFPELRRTTLATLAVAFAGWLYGVIVVPLVEGPGGAPSLQAGLGAGSETEVVFDPDREALAELFPEGAWELGPRKRLQIDQGRAFFQEYRSTPEGELEVKPFTLIVESSDPKARAADGGPIPPIVLRAPEGATLTFDEPLRLGAGRVGRLKRAVLRGEVTIERQEAPGVEPLQFQTHNVQLQDDRIFTPHPVEFRFGPHSGRGQNLVIRLLTEGEPRGASPMPKVRGIRTVELVRLDRLTVALPPERQGDRLEASRLEVRCEGSFQFDLASMQATLRHAVSLSRVGERDGGEWESLECDRLTLRFRRRPLSSEVGEASTTSLRRAPRPDDLEVSELIANGAPAVLHSPFRNFHAEAAMLAYDPIERRVRLQDDRRVLLMHEELRFEAPSLEYDMDDHRRLGRGRSVGAGRLVRLPTAEREGLEVTWQDEMLLRPHDGLDALSLYGAPRFAMGQESRFAADELHVWIREVPGAAGQKSELLPDKLLAQGNVAIASPKLAGGTQRLEVFWERGVAASPAVGGAPQGSGAPASTNGSGSPANAMNLGASGGEGPPRRMRVAGGFVRARLTPIAGGFDIKEITIEGDARLDEENTPAGVVPLAIQGRMLRVESIGQGLYSAYVVARESDGQATLAARGLELFGAELQMDQRSHRMWMEGVGEARLRPPLDQGGRSVLEGPATIRWTGGLEFDGLVVRVRGDVIIGLRSRSADGNLSTVEIRGESLDVQLTERVDFRAGGQGGAPIDVASLVLGGKVELTHWENGPDGVLRSIDRLSIADVGLDYRTGELVAAGPGLGRAIRRGAAAPIDRPGVDTAEGWTTVHVEFLERLEGNVFRKRLAFVHQVEVLSDAVTGPEDWRSRETLLASPSMVLMRGDRLETAWIEPIGGVAAGWEISMLGNAYAQARSFDAIASRMVYAQNKDLLILEGNEREDARLTWARPGSNRRDKAAARKIMYWRTDNRVEVDGASSFDATFSGRIDGANRGATPNSSPPIR